MGRPKQLLLVNGRPLLEHVVSAACAARLDDVVVVLGANAEAIREQVDWGRARTIVNPDHAAGMSSSIGAALRGLAPGVQQAVVILGDQFGVTASLIDGLLDAHQRGGRLAAAMQNGGVLQPPAVLGRELWADVMALQGDIGCRQLLRERAGAVTAVPMPAGTDVVDVDTPTDLARLRAGAGHVLPAQENGPR
jgi:molybdenum cofactor cytidylyltransferase